MTTGSSIQLANGGFVNGLSASMTCPDRTGLLGEYIFGTNAARSQKNIANNALPLLPTGAGTPSYTATGVILSGSASYGGGISGYDTQITPTPDTTLIVLRKAAIAGSDTGALWMETTGFRGFINQSGNALYYNNQSGVQPAVAGLPMPAQTGYFFMAGAGVEAGFGAMYTRTKGVASLTSLVAGSGGTNGTFALAFSGGGGAGAAGTFTVAGGAITATSITAAGENYTSAPTVSFAASTGLTGASATAVLGLNAVLSVATAGTAGSAWTTGTPSYKILPTGNIQAEFAYAAIYNRALNSTQITAAYTALAAYYANQGVTIT